MVSLTYKEPLASIYDITFFSPNEDRLAIYIITLIFSGQDWLPHYQFWPSKDTPGYARCRKLKDNWYQCASDLGKQNLPFIFFGTL